MIKGLGASFGAWDKPPPSPSGNYAYGDLVSGSSMPECDVERSNSTEHRNCVYRSTATERYSLLPGCREYSSGRAFHFRSPRTGLIANVTLCATADS